MYLIEAYVTNSSLNVNRPFTYYSTVPVCRFSRIHVEFHHQPNEALVVNCRHSDKSKEQYESENGYKILPVLEVVDPEPIISEEQFELASWLSRTTVSPFISCINSMLPKTLKTSLNDKGPKMVARLKKTGKIDGLTDKQKEIYDTLNDGIPAAQARKINAGIIKRLIDHGALILYEEEANYVNFSPDLASFKDLTDEQQAAYEKIISTDKLVTLLFGVTGSGKTEVYLHLARYFLDLNKEVLILVPEISLTPQMIQRVKERFSDVVFYHSELSDQERYEQYKRIRNGEVKIVVGTRSAVFLPFHNLGLIIMDEEHDSSYKQDSVPMYHTKNVAIRRAVTFNAKVLLASATPSLDSYTHAIKGDYELAELSHRINLKIPEISVVDLQKEMRSHHSFIISDSLHKALSNTLDENKQAIILLNRRGYAPIIRCGDCGSTLYCKDCDSPLSFHKDENVLKCHQCGRIYAVPVQCPNCGSKSLFHYGFGTKKVEEELQHLFPEAKIARMDRDNVSRKGAHQKILDAFERKETDILVGTQMIAKGLDFPDVTLVGILNADSGLMHQDYNSAKMTFDLLMQASGRSGRAEDPGKVIIQAFNVEHYAIKAVLQQDYRYFYNIEMNYRSKASYPPYSHIVEIVLTDMNEYRLERSCEIFYEGIEKLPYKKYKPYDLPKLKRSYRKRILLMDKDILSLLRDTTEIVNSFIIRSLPTKIKVDIDPLYLE